ncbi:UNVERIFIED_ORG: hypothetical protein GGE63_001205 [Rhizobium esperanzae]|uniref:Uncharacterized protein n=1 Tax=Rhizobium etli TaxID=29449 RepID=A0A7W6ZIV6_RHIET|nr:hypothetical protein [Rhizobium etli]MBB4536908.1 hypothetical protein [Rhizobium etli]
MESQVAPTNPELVIIALAKAVKEAFEDAPLLDLEVCLEP